MEELLHPQININAIELRVETNPCYLLCFPVFLEKLAVQGWIYNSNWLENLALTGNKSLLTGEKKQK